MESIWAQDCEIPEREQLRGDKKTQVAVIGAGMAGILTAYALQQAGCQTVVVEADRIAGGQTRNTTAKITSQHGLIYHRLVKGMGKEKARQYAMANEAALREYRRIIEAEGIDCDFEECSAYVYGMDRGVLEAEAEAAIGLGLPAGFVQETPLPVPAAGAVCFARQAQFHPLKFLRALSEKLCIYERSRVLKVDHGLLQTAQGRLQAEQIVFACHYPFVNFPGMYFARMHQERSYVLALAGAQRLEGMWVGTGKNSHSFRCHGELLLFGGGSHRSGENPEGGRYAQLRRLAREFYPDSREVACWSAQDCMPADGVPYIGRYAAARPRWYVATGFQKWGMSSSMVSSMLIRDMICGEKNEYAAVFDPQRFGAQAVPGVLSESAHAVRQLGRMFFRIPKEKAAAIPPGHGGVVLMKGKKLGVYKEEGGALHPVDIRCPHLGCELKWNPDEQSWDCPCHGSRFDRFGGIISGPAQTDTGRSTDQP